MVLVIDRIRIRIRITGQEARSIDGREILRSGEVVVVEADYRQYLHSAPSFPMMLSIQVLFWHQIHLARGWHVVALLCFASMCPYFLCSIVVVCCNNTQLKCEKLSDNNEASALIYPNYQDSR